MGVAFKGQLMCLLSCLASSGLHLSHLSARVLVDDSAELLPCICRFPGLKRLHLVVESYGVHGVAPLASLQQLHELGIQVKGKVRGLQAVLSSCSQLRCLKLLCHEVMELSPLHSPSLQELWLTGLGAALHNTGKRDLTYPTILPCGLDMPSLGRVCMRGLMLGLGSTLLSRCNSLPQQWLAGLWSHWGMSLCFLVTIPTSLGKKVFPLCRRWLVPHCSQLHGQSVCTR